MQDAHGILGIVVQLEEDLLLCFGKSVGGETGREHGADLAQGERAREVHKMAHARLLVGLRVSLGLAAFQDQACRLT